MSNNKGLLRVLGVQLARTTHPTGDPKFAVKQSFPAAFDEVASDPFLMCDYFSMKSAGIESDPDTFPVRWHPHRGMDICSYMKAGVGRHGDSLGNRETFATPGMQWISVGSGIEHAESGGTPAGEQMTGFQIWINVPAKHKMDDPEYGTVDPKELPLLKYANDQVQVRLLAGEFDGKTGPFRTKQKLQMLDYMLQGSQSVSHEVPLELDNCLVYVYEGSGKVNNQTVQTFHVLHLDAASRDAGARSILLQSGEAGMSVMIFAGKRINEPIAWHGPFVMNSQQEIQKTLMEHRLGQFPPKRVAWDYKRLASFPKAEQDKIARQVADFYSPDANANANAKSAVCLSEEDLQKSQCL